MAAQYLTTSRLANVIQLISLGRQTGILRVIRGHGGAQEVGQIQFLDGQPVAALLGQLNGPAAINVLSNWGESLYAFDEVLSEENADAGAWPAGGIPSGASLPSNASLPSGPWPTYGYQTPPSQSGQLRLPSAASGPLQSYMPPGSHPGSQPSAPSSYPSAPLPAVGRTLVGAQMIPRRTPRGNASEPLPLDRRERMVLLLVDGRRGLADLSRLTRRSEEEVQAVIEHLRLLGLVE
jgi:hypothetical protein